MSWMWFVLIKNAMLRWVRPNSMECCFKGPDFLSVVWFGSYPTPLTPPPPVSKLHRRHTGRLRKRDNLLTGDGLGEGPNRRRRESLILYKTFNTIRLGQYLIFATHRKNDWERETTCWRKMGWVRWKSYDVEKAWSSIKTFNTLWLGQ